MNYKTFQQGADVEICLTKFNKLIKEISVTPEICANVMTKDEFNSETLRLYFKLLPAIELILEARNIINQYKENEI